MSADSLVGGAVYDKLAPGTQAFLDTVLGDTVGGVVTTTSLAGGGVLVTGTGSGGVQQGAVIAGNVPVAGELTEGQFVLTIGLPPGLTAAFEGPGAPSTPAEANAYVRSIIDAAFPANSADVSVQNERASLINSIDALTKSLTANFGAPTEVLVRVVALTDISSASAKVIGTEEVVFESTGQAGANPELMVFVMSALSPNKTLVLKGVEAALIAGSGTVRIDGDRAGFLAGDVANQALVGGGGNDTLMGGGGNDTLTGGVGNDVFALSALQGNLTITDFDVAHDKLVFNIPGINGIADAALHFTGLTQDAGSSTLHFDTGSSVTLVGVTPDELVLGMLKFTL